jgi:hypothetical protein
VNVRNGCDQAKETGQAEHAAGHVSGVLTQCRLTLARHHSSGSCSTSENRRNC